MSAKRKDNSILNFFAKKTKSLADVVDVDISESDVHSDDLFTRLFT